MPPNLLTLPTRSRDGSFHVVVESPRQSPVKLEFDPELGAMSLARPLPHGLTYPYDWGFVPGTRAPDGDPLDAMVIWDLATWPGIVLPCRALGVIRLEEDDREGGRRRNDRVIALPTKGERYEDIRSYRDLNARWREEIERFFLNVAFFADKNPAIHGWETAEYAEALIDRLARS